MISKRPAALSKPQTFLSRARLYTRTTKAAKPATTAKAGLLVGAAPVKGTGGDVVGTNTGALGPGVPPVTGLSGCPSGAWDIGVYVATPGDVTALVPTSCVVVVTLALGVVVTSISGVVVSTLGMVVVLTLNVVVPVPILLVVVTWVSGVVVVVSILEVVVF